MAKAKAVQAPAKAVATGSIEVYRDRRKEWRWRLRATNGKIVADSGEGYVRRRSALTAVERLRVLAPSARLIES